MSSPGKTGIKYKLEKILKKYPKLEYAIYAIIVLIALAIYFSGDLMPEKKKETQSEFMAQSLSLEEKLKNTLEKIEGAGEIEVMISYATSKELVPAMNVDSQQSGANGETTSSSQSSQPITVNGREGDEPMVLMEIEPQIKGVLIIAQGADDMAVKMNLARAAQTVLDIPASKVEVFEMKKTTNSKSQAKH